MAAKKITLTLKDRTHLYFTWEDNRVRKVEHGSSVLQQNYDTIGSASTLEDAISICRSTATQPVQSVEVD
jgi:hypothetical protein